MNKILKTLFGLTLFVTFTTDIVWASSGNRRNGVVASQNIKLNLASTVKSTLNDKQYCNLFNSNNVGFVNAQLLLHTTEAGQKTDATTATNLADATIKVCKLVLKKCGYDNQAVSSWTDDEFLAYLEKYFKKHERDYIKITINKDDNLQKSGIKSQKGSIFKGQIDQYTIITMFSQNNVKIHANAIGGSSAARLLNTMKGIDGTSRIEITISIPSSLKIPE